MLHLNSKPHFFLHALLGTHTFFISLRTGKLFSSKLYSRKCNWAGDNRSYFPGGSDPGITCPELGNCFCPKWRGWIYARLVGKRIGDHFQENLSLFLLYSGVNNLKPNKMFQSKLKHLKKTFQFYHFTVKELPTLVLLFTDSTVFFRSPYRRFCPYTG